MKIGVGITSKNEEGISRYGGDFKPSPESPVVINCEQLTIARDKNWLIKTLYDEGCDYIFIFDDDCFPIKAGWEQLFIAASREENIHHFILGNDEHLHKIGGQPQISYFEKGTGCMLFLTRKVIETVGYLNTKYGKYGYEHAAYSHRIHRAGLTPSWYVSVDGWEEYVYSYDLDKESAYKHDFVKENWSTQDEKSKYIAENEAVFNEEMGGNRLYYPYEQVKTAKKRIGKYKVLYYAPDEVDNTSFYRIAGVLPYINNPEFELINGCKITDWNWATFINIDLLIFQRPCLDGHIDAMLLAKSMRCKVISDFDDNLLCVDQTNPTHDFYQAQRSVIMRSIHISDEVWVTTDSIKQAYTKLNKNIHVIKNAWNDYLFPVEEKKAYKRNTKHVLWRGGVSHQTDLDDVKEDLTRIINENQEWTFNFWGDIFTHIFKRCGDNCIFRRGMETKQYFDALIDYNPNIMLFPLADTEFNRGKSNICWMEATYAGAAFLGMTDFQEYLVGSILEFAELQSLIKSGSSDVLEFYNQVSWDCITENLLLSTINKQREERIIANL